MAPVLFALSPQSTAANHVTSSPPKQCSLTESAVRTPQITVGKSSYNGAKRFASLTFLTLYKISQATVLQTKRWSGGLLRKPHPFKCLKAVLFLHRYHHMTALNTLELLWIRTEAGKCSLWVQKIQQGQKRLVFNYPQGHTFTFLTPNMMLFFSIDCLHSLSPYRIIILSAQPDTIHKTQAWLRKWSTVCPSHQKKAGLSSLGLNPWKEQSARSFSFSVFKTEHWSCLCNSVNNENKISD